MKKIIQTTNLSIGYRSTKPNIIASNLTISCDTGRLIALIGTNGIGKSTLLKTLVGIEKPISGSVFVNNISINNYNLSNFAQICSLVLTEKLPPSNLAVFELIALGRQPYTNWIGKLTNLDLDIIQNAIQQTGIQDLVNKKHFEISDGQLQKVLIAKALAQDTSIVILDEPTTHLDLPNKLVVLKLLQKLAHSMDKCILYSTHDINLAIQLSDEIIVMTTDAVYQDKPSILIKNGVFDNLFSNENIIFDRSSATFTIK